MTDRQIALDLLSKLENFYSMVRGECPSILESDINAEKAAEAIEKYKKILKN